jgi:hypothetical protein
VAGFIDAAKPGYYSANRIWSKPPQNAANIELIPLVTVTPEESRQGPLLAWAFKNYSYHAVNVVAWVYACRNVPMCNKDNTQTAPADYKSRVVIPLAARDLTRGAPESLYIYHVGTRGPGFSARISYCYFTSVDDPTEKDTFDVVTWANTSTSQTPCRDILSPPQTGSPGLEELHDAQQDAKRDTQ